MASLSGHWVLRVGGSDAVPPVVSPEGLPFCALSSGRTPDESLHITQSLSNIGEEINFEFIIASNVVKSRKVFVKSLSSEIGTGQNGVSLFIVLGVTQNFQEFSIMRIGPKPGLRCIERYKMDYRGWEMLATVDMITSSGTSVRFARYFDRHPTLEMPRLLDVNPVSAWLNPKYRSLDLFETTSVGIIQHISMSDTASKRKAMETKNELAHIIGKHSGESSTVIFILQVVSGSTKWLIGHRYSEYETLKKFMEAQLGVTPASPLALAPPFPGKTAFMTARALEDRKEKLDRYISFFVDSKAMGSQNVADALFSFFEIPQHLAAYDMKMQALIEETRQKEVREMPKAKKRSSIFQSTPSEPAMESSASVKSTPPRPGPTRRASISAMIGMGGPAKAPEKSEFAVEPSNGGADRGGRQEAAEQPAQVPAVMLPVARRASLVSFIGASLKPADKSEFAMPADTDKAESSAVTFRPRLSSNDKKPSAPLPAAQPQLASPSSSPSATAAYVPSGNASTFSAGGRDKPSVLPSPRARATTSASAVDRGDEDDDHSSVSTTYDNTGAASSASSSRRQSFMPSLGIAKAFSTRQRSASQASQMVAAAEEASKIDFSEINSYSYPQDALYAMLRVGVLVLKHGRAGKPKKRVLRCNHSVSRIYWEKPVERSFLSRRKTVGGEQELAPDLPSDDKSIALDSVLAVKKGTDEEDGQKIMGTANLRRNCKREDLELCFYLVLPSRTFDIQCLNAEEYQALYTNFDKLIRKMVEDRERGR